jgi:hypothetical protein
MNQLEEILVGLTTESLIYEQTVQPLMVVVGDPFDNEPLTYYVVINNIRYQQNSFISSLDMCFKSFFSLDASYPAECVRVWFYIQKVIYGIETIHDPNISQISGVVADTKLA